MPTKGTYRLSPEQCADACRRYASGESSHRIAAAFGTTANTILAAVRRAGITIRPRFRPRRPPVVPVPRVRMPRLSPDVCAEVCRRYAAGETSRQLAAAFGVSKPTILVALHRAGVAVRPRRSVRGRRVTYPKYQKPRVPLTAIPCKHCGVVQFVGPGRVADGKHVFCGKDCRAAWEGDWQARFWEHVEKRHGCWGWSGAADRAGYGITRGPHGRIAAHRLSYILAYGPIPWLPPGTGTAHVLHHCDNPPCTNPACLWLGTPADNAADMRAKGRGKGQPNSPLLRKRAL